VTEADFSTAGSSDAGVRVDHAGPVATVSLCRPAVLNAQTPQVWAALRSIGRDLPGDVRVVVVRGEGRAFSSGLDVSLLQSSWVTDLVSQPEDAAADRIADLQEAFSWLRRPDLITVAAVQGHAIGAGFQLALACDLRVLADDAKFCMAEVTLGLVPDLGGTKRLVELVGYGRALELCVTGRRVGAEEALRTGLANLVVPLADLDGAVDDLVAAVLAAPRDAAVEIKALLLAAEQPWPAQLAAERAAQVRRLRSLAGIGD
jgi:enoyl-CoA hydratase/carnithine racemase